VVLATLLTTMYVDGLPFNCFGKLLGRHGVDIPRQNFGELGYPVRCGLPADAEFISL